MKVKIVRMTMCIAMVGLFIGCVIKKQIQVQVPEFIFSYAENQAEDYPTTVGGYKFAELVEERTNGRIKIIVQAEGILGNERQVAEQLRFGGIDFARISLSELSGVIPEFNVLQMPYLYADAEHMWKVLDGQIGDAFLSITEGFDMVGLSWYDAGARNFYNSVRPIDELEDIQGLKIRVQESEIMADIIEALGGIAVPMGYDEVYASLERGIIDGAENNWPSYESTDHYKVAKYYTIDEHIRIPEIQLCAQATWNKLSPEDQQIIRLCAQESALYERELWMEKDRNFRAITVENGVQITVLSLEEKAKFQNAVAGVYEKYCADYMDAINVISEIGR